MSHAWGAAPPTWRGGVEGLALASRAGLLQWLVSALWSLAAVALVVLARYGRRADPGPPQESEGEGKGGMWAAGELEDGPVGMRRLAVRGGRYVFSRTAAPLAEEDADSSGDEEETAEDERCAPWCWGRISPSRRPPLSKDMAATEKASLSPAAPPPLPESSFGSLEDVWEEGVVRLFEDEYVAEAGAVLQDLETLVAHGEARGDRDAARMAARLQTSDSERAEQVRRRALELEEAAECLRGSEGGQSEGGGTGAWAFGQRRFGVDTWYRHEADGTLSLKLDGHLEGVEIFYILGCIREVDLFPTWAPFCHRSELLRLNRRADLVAYMKLSPPFISRDIFMHAWAADHTREDGTIILSARSVDAFPGVVTPKRGGFFCRRMNVRRFVACIRPLTRESLRNVIICNVDVKAPLPASLTNFVVRQMAGVLLYRLQRQASRVSRRVREGRECEHSRRIARDEHGFYAFLRTRIDALFAGGDAPTPHPRAEVDA